MFYGVINESTYVDPFEIELENFDNFCKSLNIVQESGIVLQEGAWDTIKEKIKKAWNTFIEWVKNIFAKIKALFTKKTDAVNKAEESNKAIQDAADKTFEQIEIAFCNINQSSAINKLPLDWYDIAFGGEDLTELNKEIDEDIKAIDEFDIDKEVFENKQTSIKSSDEAKKLSSEITDIINTMDKSIKSLNEIRAKYEVTIFQNERKLKEALEGDQDDYANYVATGVEKDSSVLVNLSGHKVPANVAADYIKAYMKIDKSVLNFVITAIKIYKEKIDLNNAAISKIKSALDA